MRSVREQFAAATLGCHWRPYETGTGALEVAGSSLRLTTTDARAESYSNAQIDDYQGLSRRRFLWHPPLRLTVRARFSDPVGRLRGTAGFGFWNDPFFMTGRRLPTLPRALWFFFASSPSDMKLDYNTPGYGWKAATIDALRPSAFLWAPAVPLAVLLMNLQPGYDLLWPAIQRALRVRETMIPADMTKWHIYSLEWELSQVRFSITAAEGAAAVHILDAPSPQGPLGFVMWLDNQYLVAAPWGVLRWGLLDVPGRQWMEVDRLDIEPLADGCHE